MKNLRLSSRTFGIDRRGLYLDEKTETFNENTDKPKECEIQ